MNREEILAYIAWYKTPRCGVSPDDTIATAIAKPYKDQLLFDLASCDSGVRINAIVAGSPVDTFFGHKTARYSGFIEIKAKKRPIDTVSK